MEITACGRSGCVCRQAPWPVQDVPPAVVMIFTGTGCTSRRSLSLAVAPNYYSRPLPPPLRRATVTAASPAAAATSTDVHGYRRT